MQLFVNVCIYFVVDVGVDINNIVYFRVNDESCVVVVIVYILVMDVVVFSVEYDDVLFYICVYTCVSTHALCCCC